MTTASRAVTTAPKLKRIVDIDQASIGMYLGQGPLLFGIPRNHPGAYLNGKRIRSSLIVSLNSNNEVETLNTVYRVQSWKEQDVVN